MYTGLKLDNFNTRKKQAEIFQIDKKNERVSILHLNLPVPVSYVLNECTKNTAFHEDFTEVNSVMVVKGLGSDDG